MTALEGAAVLHARLLAAPGTPLLPFYGHRAPADRSPGAWLCSQHASVPFTVDGLPYATAEAWMMAGKARLFGDNDTLAQILAAPDPATAKRLGRQVRGFDAARWEQECYRIVALGNWYKFTQNPAARDWLLGTAPAVLVEATSRDRIWGIGLDLHHPDVLDPARWRGRNLLGYALTEVRDALAARAT